MGNGPVISYGPRSLSGNVAKLDNSVVNTFQKILTGNFDASGTLTLAHGVSSANTSILSVLVFSQKSDNSWQTNVNPPVSIGGLSSSDITYSYDATNIVVKYGSAFNNRPYRVVINLVV